MAESLLWEDREVRFDLTLQQMKIRSGEKIIDKLDFIEDTKGNAGDKGRLTITNLRIMWNSLSVLRINLSIGLHCIQNVSTKVINSRLRGTAEALHILTKSNNSRFEFIFTNLVPGNTRHFTSVMGVHKAYLSSKLYRDLKLRGKNRNKPAPTAQWSLQSGNTRHFTPVMGVHKAYLSSKLYRDLKLRGKNRNKLAPTAQWSLQSGNTRHFTSVMVVHKAYLSSKLYGDLKLKGAIVRKKELKLLPKEHIYNEHQGIWNLSSDQGNLGVFTITNVRIVWFADMNESFNISLPYIQISSIRLRESKFGLALVIETYEQSGGYVLGFRIDPQNLMFQITRELQSYHSIHSITPEFGIDYSVTETAILPEESPIVPEPVVELDETAYNLSNTLTTYSANQGTNLTESRKLIFCPELGVCIEQPKPGYTISSLWEVIQTPSQNTSKTQSTYASPSDEHTPEGYN